MPTSTSSQLPFQIGGIWSSEAISAFSNLCIKKAVTNVFDFEQTREVPPGWAVSLNFGFNALIGDGDKFSINLPGPFGSKKEAKAAAAGEGLKILTEAATKKNKESTGKETESNGDGTENENWVSLLGEYCQGTRKPMPIFQEFRLGSSHSMEVTIHDRPSEPFGCRNSLFSSKKAARMHAAREAVIWLRETGKIPRKSCLSVDTTAIEAGTIQLGSQNPVAREVTKASQSLSETHTTGLETCLDLRDQDGSSLGEQIMVLCRKLGCAQPTYKLTSDPRIPSMWSGAAYFTNDPDVALPIQPIGEIKMIFGKKKAKQEVSRGVLMRLQELLAKRQEEFSIASGGSMASLEL